MSSSRSFTTEFLTALGAEDAQTQSTRRKDWHFHNKAFLCDLCVSAVSALKEIVFS